MSMHTPAHKFVTQGSVTNADLSPKQTLSPEFMEWWRTEGYKIHVTDSNSFQFAQKVWVAAQQSNQKE